MFLILSAIFLLTKQRAFSFYSAKYTTTTIHCKIFFQSLIFFSILIIVLASAFPLNSVSVVCFCSENLKFVHAYSVYLKKSNGIIIKIIASISI